MLTEPKVMDLARPTLLPVQKDLAHAVHQLAAAQLADQLERQDPVEALFMEFMRTLKPGIANTKPTMRKGTGQ